MELRCRIKTLRWEKRMTQQDLSERTGVTIGLISAYENNHTYPSAPTLWKLAVALDCFVDELYEYSGREGLF